MGMRHRCAGRAPAGIVVSGAERRAGRPDRQDPDEEENVESGQIVEMVLMQERLRNQWSYDEGSWRLEEARRVAREARGPWWSPLVPGRSRRRRGSAVSTAAPTAAAAGA